MWQMTFHAGTLRIHIPLSHGSIKTRSNEQVFFFGVPRSSRDGSYMTLRIGHILNIHVTSNGSLKSLAVIPLKETSLTTSAATEVILCILVRGEAESSYRVAIEWSKCL